MNKKKNNRTAAVILASGKGERFGGIIPKQYKKVLNLTILELSLITFIKNININTIYVTFNISHKKYIQPIRKKYKKIIFIQGENNRQKTSLKALNVIYKKKYYTNILIHDAVRPFTTNVMIDNLIKGLKYAEGVIPVLKVTDSIKLVKKDLIIKNIDRKDLYFSQTPQAFSIQKLKKAYDNIKKSTLKNYTDDAQIFTAAGFKVNITNGNENNIKITTINDFKNAKKMILSDTKIIKVGQGIDYHTFAEGNKIILFGIKIPFDKSIKAHSDGDLGVHALIDSILGTLAAGDIGTHFPDTKNKYKNISSLELLSKILRLLKKNKGEIIHVDNTIICEKPKLQKYILRMRKKISDRLNIELDSLSIKATTTEKMGFIGRGEGIAVHSIATIEYIK